MKRILHYRLRTQLPNTKSMQSIAAPKYKGPMNTTKLITVFMLTEHYPQQRQTKVHSQELKQKKDINKHLSWETKSIF